MKDQLPDERHVGVRQPMTRVKFADQPDQMAPVGAVGVGIPRNAGDGGRRRSALAPMRQSIAGRRPGAVRRFSGGRIFSEHRQHVDRSDAGEHRSGVRCFAGAHQLDGQLAQASRNVLDCVAHTGGA